VQAVEHRHQVIAGAGEALDGGDLEVGPVGKTGLGGLLDASFPDRRRRAAGSHGESRVRAPVKGRRCRCRVVSSLAGRACRGFRGAVVFGDGAMPGVLVSSTSECFARLR